MRQHQSIRTAVRLALAASLTASFGLSARGYAAQNSQSPANLGKVTVTGTRIKRTNVETAQPITRISRQQIQQSGFTNVAQLLGRLSFSGSFYNPTVLFSDGTAGVNLRNLGGGRTLLLVDGRRWVAGNLNTIPTSIIDHIEVLQDGASAVYGSDAIAGVVNVITVKNFNGAEVHAYYGIHNDHQTGSWDGQVKQYDFTVGSGNDRGNVVFNATYREQNPIPDSARLITRTPIAGEPGYIGGQPNTPRGRFRLFGPAASGRTFGQATCGTYDPNSPTNTLCDLTLQNAPAQPSLQNFRNFKQTDLYNPQQNRLLLRPDKDVTTYVQGHYNLFDNLTFTANAAYIREETTKHIIPEAVSIGITAVDTANGRPIGVAASNPYNPFGVALVADPNNPCIAAGSCIGLNRIDRLAPEAGHNSRGEEFNRDYFHIFAGFNGYVNLFNREIDWNVGFAQNRSEETRIETGRYITTRAAKALGPASQCTSPCVPLNLFGGASSAGGTITPAQLHYITYESHQLNQSNLRDWTANISSDIYDLPAGPLGLAIGYERLDNYSHDTPDAIMVEGNDSDFNGTPLTGRIVRDAEYAELNIPLLADRPGAKSLSIDIANRWTQFKQTGGVPGQSQQESFLHNSSGRLNIRWQVISDLLLRASWSQGFRAPGVGELFGGTYRATLISYTDPCAGGPNGGYQGGPLPPNCPNGTPDVQPQAHGEFTTGSNPNLQPEKSISRTVGFVYSPSQVPGLDVNADYFKIEINGAVGLVGAQNIINGCFNNFSFCNLVTVHGNQVTDVRNVSTNVGGLLTEGIDVGLNYKFPSSPFGDFDVRINGTFLKTFDTTNINRATSTGFATSHLAGISDQPKRRFNGYLDWDYGNWSAQYRIEYFDHVVDQCTVTIAGYCTYPNRTTNFQGTPGQLSFGRNHLGATVYHDINVAYTVPSINTTFAVGVNNLFDKKPPITGSGGFDGTVYRLPSRFLYGSIRVKF